MSLFTPSRAEGGCTGRASLLFSGEMAAVTLRERNKGDKLQRIKSAARRLIDAQGFDATSTREIAAEAGVGLSTLFLYASDKRDLLFLAYNPDLEQLTRDAFSQVGSRHGLFAQIVEAFGQFYRFYSRDRRLSRDLLRELTFYTEGQNSTRFHAIRQITMEAVEALVASARARGELRTQAQDADVARVVFYVFAAEIRRWLGQEEVSVEEGLQRFAELLEVVLPQTGTAGESRSSSASRGGA